MPDKHFDSRITDFTFRISVLLSCIYIPHFPAWAVERSLERRQPVIVVASGRVVAASGRLRRRGIEPGISAERAETLAPEAHIRSRDIALERAAGEEVQHRLHGITPFIEPAGDALFYFRNADEEQLRLFVREIGAKAGSASHRTTARLAAIRAAPGSFLSISDERVHGFLKRFPLKLLADIDFDNDLIERLDLFGFTSPADMLHLTQRHFEAQFGEDGIRLHAILHPSTEPAIPLFRPPPVVRLAFDFEPAVEEPHELVPVLQYLVEEATRHLGTLHCRRLRLFLHEKEQIRQACRLLPESTSAATTLFNLSKLELENLLDHRAQIEVLELELGALHVGDTSQTSLFRERPSVYRVVEAINRRFPGAIRQVEMHDGGVFPEDGWDMRAVG